MGKHSLRIGRGYWLLAIMAFVIVTALGCVAVQSFPHAARPGDTVMLAVGSPDGMTVNNTSATYTPNGGNPVPLTIRSIFKLYPDKTSAAWLSSNASNVEGGTGHGPWTTIAAIDLPTVGLVEGSGVVRFTTAATYPPPPARDINAAAIALEILPAAAGAGAADPFTYELAANAPVVGDLSQLEPNRRIVVRPVFAGTGSTTYGAIEVRTTIPNLGSLSSYADLRVIVDDKIGLYAENRRVQYFWSVQGDDLVVSFISPVGGLDYSYVHFSIISSTIMSLVDAGFITVNTLMPIVTYFDVNGGTVVGSDTFIVVDKT